MRRFLVTLLISGVGAVAGAQQSTRADTTTNDPHAVQPERPTVATHAGTVAPGWFEIETGVERDRVPSSSPAYLTPTALKFGLASHVQLGVFGSFNRPAPGMSGLGDIAAGIKWRLLDDAPIVGDFAVLPSVKLPAGDASKGTGTGTTDASLLLISSHDFGGVSVDINAGYTHRSGDGSVAPTNFTLWTFSAGGPVVAGFGWAAEVYGYPGTGGESGQPPVVAFLGGPTYLARSWLAFDAGFIAKIAGGQPSALYLGGVWNVGRLWKAGR